VWFQKNWGLRMAKIVTINNVKGGVAKTTTATNLAAGLARKGKRVLLIDSDPQANASLNLYPELRVDQTIKDLFQGTSITEIISPSVETGLDIVPSCLAFSTIELELAGQLARETFLKRALKPIEGNYDIILIDTQPSVGVIPINALCAANEVIIPVHEAYALDAMSQMVNVILQVKQTLNPDLTIGGVLLTMYDPRTTLAKEVRERLFNKFGTLLFETTIPRNIRLAECPTHKKSIFEYAPESAGAAAYQALTEEVMTRWGMVQ
jgi:ATPases involved in chromosome partitioning